MKDSVMEWGKRWLEAHPVTGLRVLEVGSLNVNGSLREIAEAQKPYEYLGIDIVDGPGVDAVVDVTLFVDPAPSSRRWNFVISTEMLEHAKYWHAALTSMKLLLKPDGWLVLTTRAPGQMPHNPPDYWRFTEEQITAALADMIDVKVEPDPAGCGVFATARKPADFKLCDLSGIHPEAVND